MKIESKSVEISLTRQEIAKACSDLILQKMGCRVKSAQFTNDGAVFSCEAVKSGSLNQALQTINNPGQQLEARPEPKRKMPNRGLSKFWLELFMDKRPRPFNVVFQETKGRFPHLTRSQCRQYLRSKDFQRLAKITHDNGVWMRV